MKHITDYLTASHELLFKINSDVRIKEQIVMAAAIMTHALTSGRKIIACGNGGSMSDAMHFCSELTGRYKDARDPLAAFALSDPGAMSCIANDFGYTTVFGRQIHGLGNPGDILLAISTSGNSENILFAIECARQQLMGIVLLTGERGLKSEEYSHVIQIRVPSTVTNHIQEAHINIIHILVELIEKNL